MVFAYLEPTEAATFRWAGRITAEIGLQYLAPIVHLRLNEESYDRFFAISEHPVARNSVLNLEYETEGLGALNWKDIEEMFMSRQSDSREPDSFTSERAWRASKRDDKRQNVQLMNQAWLKYGTYLAGQHKVQQAGFFRQEVVKAMKRCPNLKKISTPADGVNERYVAEMKELQPAFFLEARKSFLSDIGATSSIVLAAESAGLRLDGFCCQRFHWQIFLADKEGLTALKRMMRHLKTMHIVFADPQLFSANSAGFNAYLISEEILEEGCVLDLIASAPDLENLRLNFSKWTVDATYPTASHTIGNFLWPCLKTVSLNNLSSDQHDLVNFCKRHAKTLKDISLTDMELHGASWDVIFHRMRRVFRLGQQLDACKLSGRFWSPGCYFNMDMKKKVGVALCVTISEYIRDTNVGDLTFDEYRKAVELSQLPQRFSS